MARSGSTNYSVSTTNIIQDAFLVIGLMLPGQTMSDDMSALALRTLNLMVKNWMGGENRLMAGVKMWQRAQSELDPGGTPRISYTIAETGANFPLAMPVDIIEMSVKDANDLEYPLAPMTIQEYRAVLDKTATSNGVPTKYHYERGYSYGTVYFDRFLSTEAANYTFPFTYLRILQDLDSVSDDVDFPQEWYEPLKYNLALRLAAEFRKPASQELAMLAERSLLQASYFAPQVAAADWYFQPEYY